MVLAPVRAAELTRFVRYGAAAGRWIGDKQIRSWVTLREFTIRLNGSFGVWSTLTSDC